MQAWGNTSYSLGFSFDIWVNTECKAIFAEASFRIRLVNFAKLTWCSNSSKFLRSRVVSTIRSTYCPVCVARFYWSLWTRSQTFATFASSWCWQVMLADPAIRGEQPDNPPSNFQKHVQVEYISWLQPCLLSKKSHNLWFRWKPWQSDASFFTDHGNAYLKRNALHWKLADSLQWKLS